MFAGGFVQQQDCINYRLVGKAIAELEGKER